MSSGRSDRATLRSLSSAERRLLAAALLVLPLSVVLLRVLGYGRVQRLAIRLSPLRPGRTTGTDRAATVDAGTRMVDLVASRLPLRPACLPRSVTLWFLLRRRGIDTTVCIGVRQGERPLDAHAWVELDGRPINDVPDIAEQFATLRPAPPPS